MVGFKTKQHIFDPGSFVEKSEYPWLQLFCWLHPFAMVCENSHKLTKFQIQVTSADYGAFLATLSNTDATTYVLPQDKSIQLVTGLDIVFSVY